MINPGDLKFFKGMCEANKRKFIPKDPPSDYDRTIIKTTEKKKRQSKSSSSSDVPQLGAQKKQSIEPLVVGQTTQEQDFVTFYPLFNFDNGMNLISKSLTILTSAQLLVVFAFAHIFWRYFVFAGF